VIPGYSFTRVLFTNAKAHTSCGATGTRRFPTPSLGGKFHAQLGRTRRGVAMRFGIGSLKIESGICAGKRDAHLKNDYASFVMTGLVPAIHVFLVRHAAKTWSARHKAGHDELPTARPLRRESFQKICTSPLKRSSLYPVIGNGLAPAIACRAALAIVPGFAGWPCNAASDAESRSGIGAMPPAVMRMNWKRACRDHGARTHSTSGHSA